MLSVFEEEDEDWTATRWRHTHTICDEPRLSKMAAPCFGRWHSIIH